MRRFDPSRESRQIAAALLVLSATLSAGCGTSNNVGGFTPTCLTFDPEKAPTAGEVTSVWGSESTCDQTEVELVVSDVADVWSTSFEVSYPADLMYFLAVQAGDSFLTADGVPLLVEAQEQDSGLVVIGVSREDSSIHKGISPTVDNPLLVRLVFLRIAGSGSGDMTIESANLQKVENVGDLPSNIDPAVPFSGGSFLIEH